MSLSTFNLIKMSWDSLRGNRLRSALTTLGVFMGVMAVSATLQVRTISTSVISTAMEKREAPQIFAFLFSKDGRQLKLEDVDYLKNRLTGVEEIGTRAWITQDTTVIFDQKEAVADINAVSEKHLKISGRTLLQGRFFSSADFINYRSVVVIDRFLAENLFEGKNPIGERVYWNGRLYIVVGIVDTKMRNPQDEPSGEMLLPMSLYSALTGRYNVGLILMRPEQVGEMEQLKEQVETLLKQRYPDGEIYVGANIEDILEQQKTLKMVSRALLAVGAIALLVGGVGIANITIAAVIERTPEIGLRRAIGATSGDIMFQFILEAAILSLLGGVLAISTVHGLTLMVADRFELPYEFERQTAGLALGSALLVGVGAGFLPAMQASKLDPVQALRSR